MSSKMTNAAPILDTADQAQAGIKPAAVGDYPCELADVDSVQRRVLSDNARREPTTVVQPFLQLVQPLANGVGQGSAGLGLHAE